MARTVAIGKQKFDELVEGGYFVVDKTGFIRDWWLSGDDVTLICRPRRFGKTLTLDMVRCFLSRDFAGRGEALFGDFEVWRDPSMRALQGTVPVVFLSFASCKGTTLEDSLAGMRQVIRTAVRDHDYLLDSPTVNDDDRALLRRVSDTMDTTTATTCLNRLCAMLRDHWGVAPVVLLDEYDTPMQEAWLKGYWDGMSDFVRQLFNVTFKTNPALGRGLITGITRVASESIFSDLNNPAVATVTKTKYEDWFGFTEDEVRTALEEYGLAHTLEDVRYWYDGFTFGRKEGIYNPWSITGYLDEGELDAFWANSSSNDFVSELVRQGDADLKSDFETLLAGGTVCKRVDERVNYGRLHTSADAVWSLLLATGYVRVDRRLPGAGARRNLSLALTNHEVAETFDAMVEGWFSMQERPYNQFCRALLDGDVDGMNVYLGEVASACVSNFDGGVEPSEYALPERFYHGLVLGMLVSLRGRYTVESNRERRLGRYDVALVPCRAGGPASDPAIIIEFKVFDSRRGGERTLEDTVARALRQIDERGYATALMERGIPADRIRCYGFAFRGKEVLVG